MVKCVVVELLSERFLLECQEMVGEELKYKAGTEILRCTTFLLTEDMIKIREHRGFMKESM